MEIVTLTFSCVFGTFPYGVQGQVWYFIVSIPDLCLLPYFEYKIKAKYNDYIKKHFKGSYENLLAKYLKKIWNFINI